MIINKPYALIIFSILSCFIFYNIHTLNKYSDNSKRKIQIENINIKTDDIKNQILLQDNNVSDLDNAKNRKKISVNSTKTIKLNYNNNKRNSMIHKSSNLPTKISASAKSDDKIEHFTSIKNTENYIKNEDNNYDTIVADFFIAMIKNNYIDGIDECQFNEIEIENQNFNKNNSRNKRNDNMTKNVENSINDNNIFIEGVEAIEEIDIVDENVNNSYIDYKNSMLEAINIFSEEVKD